MKNIYVILLIVIFAGCQAEKSPLQKIELKKGIKREKAEKLIESAIGKKSNYNVYLDSSTEGKYTDKKTILIIQYKPGAPAPWIKTEDGKMQHLPPIDAEVISWKYMDKNSQ
jgi:hypothetical protein